MKEYLKCILAIMFIILIIISVVIFLLSFNNQTVSAKTEENFVCIDRQNEGIMNLYRYYDKETKVMYLITYTDNSRFNSATVTIMLNTEGKPLLYEEE